MSLTQSASFASRKPLVVLTRRIFPDMLDALRQEWQVTDNQQDEVLSEAQLGLRLQQADALLADPTRPVTASLLQAAPRLQVVSNIAVGYNNIDVAACTEAGIVATNTPDVLTQATADHAWALLLAAARRVSESERWTRAGNWKGFAFDSFLGRDVYGAKLGIWGMGRIGMAIAQRALGFGMSVQYHNRHPIPLSDWQAALPAGVTAPAPQWVDRQQLLSQSDYLMLTLPYRPETHHTIGAEQLAQMPAHAILINMARGGIVDDAALIQALRTGQIAGAALDVMENEPAFDPGFLGLENIVLTPHTGSATHRSRRGMVGLAVSNVRMVLAGQEPAAILNPAVWSKRRLAVC